MALQARSSLLNLVFCLLCWAGPSLAQSNPDEDPAEAQGNQCCQLPSEVWGQRLLLWFLTLAGFYGLVWILDDFTGEQCISRRPKDAGIRNSSRTQAQVPCPPQRRCSMQSNLTSLRQTEQDLVTLLYKLRKHKIALATGWLPSDQTAGQGALPNDMVFYTIQDET